VAYGEHVRAQIASLELTSRVTLLGRLAPEQVRAELARAHVFISPFIELPTGDKDGIPTALLEAMAAGCAIVATDAGSILETVDDGVEALVVPQRDAGAIAKAVAGLIEDEHLRARLGMNAMRRVRAQFDVRTCERAFHARVRACIRSNGRVVPANRPAA
jgi:glycosyltransferase involved in cell wall biosynthesis